MPYAVAWVRTPDNVILTDGEGGVYATVSYMPDGTFALTQPGGFPTLTLQAKDLDSAISEANATLLIRFTSATMAVSA